MHLMWIFIVWLLLLIKWIWALIATIISRNHIISLRNRLIFRINFSLYDSHASIWMSNIFCSFFFCVFIVSSMNDFFNYFFVFCFCNQSFFIFLWLRFLVFFSFSRWTADFATDAEATYKDYDHDCKHDVFVVGNSRVGLGNYDLMVGWSMHVDILGGSRRLSIKDCYVWSYSNHWHCRLYMVIFMNNSILSPWWSLNHRFWGRNMGHCCSCCCLLLLWHCLRHHSTCWTCCHHLHWWIRYWNWLSKRFLMIIWYRANLTSRSVSRCRYWMSTWRCYLWWTHLGSPAALCISHQKKHDD